MKLQNDERSKDGSFSAFGIWVRSTLYVFVLISAWELSRKCAVGRCVLMLSAALQRYSGRNKSGHMVHMFGYSRAPTEGYNPNLSSDQLDEWCARHLAPCLWVELTVPHRNAARRDLVKNGNGVCCAAYLGLRVVRRILLSPQYCACSKESTPPPVARWYACYTPGPGVLRNWLLDM